MAVTTTVAAFALAFLGNTRRHDIQQIDTQHNEIQNETQNNEIQNDTQNNEIQNNDTQYNNK
jgi:hypothetical protein